VPVTLHFRSNKWRKQMFRFLATAAVLATLTGTANAQLIVAGNCSAADPTGTPLNVRSAPNGSILGSLYNGTRVTVVTVRGDWARVVTERGGGKSGWVYLNFLDCD
jgi:uncharacterized protein YgiM (DUF1202 family)